MKYIYLLVFTCFITNNINAQSKFFLFTEGWKNLATVECDSFYVSIGLGFTRTYQNHLQFTKLNKQGSIIDEWIFKLDSTSTTEFSFQQAIVTDKTGNQIIAGTITYPPNTLTSIAARLRFNNDFTEYLGDNWVYEPFNSPAQFRISYPKENDRFIHAVNYNHNGAVRSMILEADIEGNAIWEQNYKCAVSSCICKLAISSLPMTVAIFSPISSSDYSEVAE